MRFILPRPVVIIAILMALACAAAWAANTPALRPPDTPPAPLEKGLVYDYYESSYFDLTKLGNLTPVDSDYCDTFSLDAHKRNEYFAFRFTGYIKLSQDGTYTFYSKSDDDSLIYIGDTLVVDNKRRNGSYGAQESTGSIALQAGLHRITVTYDNGIGGYSLEVGFTSPNGEKQPVHPGSLFHDTSMLPIGTVDIAGKTYKVLLVDANHNGVFGDPYVLGGQDKPTGVVKRGDILRFYFDGSKLDVPYGQPLQLDGMWYLVSSSDGGKTFSATPVTLTTGEVKIAADQWSGTLIGTKYMFNVTGGRQPITLPADTYVPVRFTLMELATADTLQATFTGGEMQTSFPPTVAAYTVTPGEQTAIPFDMTVHPLIHVTPSSGTCTISFYGMKDVNGQGIPELLGYRKAGPLFGIISYQLVDSTGKITESKMEPG